MKKNRLLLIIMSIFIFTGCSANYEINISDDQVNENIKLTVPNDMNPVKKEKFLGYTELDTVAITWDYTNPYYTMTKEKGINENYYNYNYIYDKTHPIKDGRVLKTCFDHYKIEETNSYYMFVFKGKFKCSYDFNKINIKLKTNNKVSKHNSIDYNKKTGIYNWVLDKSNFNDADIRFIVLKNDYPDKIKDTSNGIIKNVGITVLLVLVIIFGFILTKNIIKIVDNFEK